MFGTEERFLFFLTYINHIHTYGYKSSSAEDISSLQLLNVFFPQLKTKQNVQNAEEINLMCDCSVIRFRSSHPCPYSLARSWAGLHLVGVGRHAMRGAERSLVRVLLSLTPLRMASSMLPSAASSANSSSPRPSRPATAASLTKCCCWMDSGAPGGLVEA